jgi:hypothetical protein
MLRYLLVTNICIDVIKRRPQELLDTFNRHAGQMAISAITFSEGRQGCGDQFFWIGAESQIAQIIQQGSLRTGGGVGHEADRQTLAVGQCHRLHGTRQGLALIDQGPCRSKRSAEGDRIASPPGNGQRGENSGCVLLALNFNGSNTTRLSSYPQPKPLAGPRLPAGSAGSRSGNGGRS